MESQLDSNSIESIDHPLFEIFSIAFMSFAWAVFTLSAGNYQQVYWYKWLLISRIAMALIGVSLISFIVFKKAYRANYAILFLVASVGVQASHGFLEGAQSVDFYNFVGIIFILSCLSYHGYFSRWIKVYFPIQMLFFILPLFFKSSSYFISFGTFINNFSLMVSGLIIGFAIAILTSSRYTYSVKYLKAKLELANIATQVAHDIQSPLSAIKTIAKIKEDLSLDHKEVIIEAASRIEEISKNLINKYLDIESENQNETSEVQKILESIISEKKVNLNDNVVIKHNELPLGIRCHINETELKTILSNILNNSIEAISSHGVIQINTEVNKNLLLVQIEDNGKGIPKNNLAKLFEKGSSFGKSRGLGLGLYNAKTVLTKWNGNIEIMSSEGIGTKVQITLPLINS